MKIENPFEPRRPRSYVIVDLESAVLEEAGHQRYRAMERWVPGNDDGDSRRGYTRAEDPLKTPRWVFQTVVTASAMVLTEHEDGNVNVSRFVTLSAPDHDDREVIAGVLQVLADAPSNAEFVSWAGSFHDLPLIACAAMKHGLSLPANWGWIAFGGDGRVRHVDFARVLTGGFKMKPIHQAEYAAALDIPAKMTVAPFMVAKLINAGQFELVQEVCEGDVITLALLLARWRKLLDGRADIDVVEDRILRSIEQLREGRSYIPALQARRAASFARRVGRASNDAEVLAPWLSTEAA